MGKDPLVLILGWGGCHIKQLGKYVQLYNKLGFESIAKIPPAFDSNFWIQLSEADRFYHREFRPIVHEDRPLIVHTFSVNGSGQFANIWDNLSREQDGNIIKKRVKGWIADSGPANSGRLGQFFRAHLNEIPRSKRNPLTLTYAVIRRLPFIASAYPKFKVQTAINKENMKHMVPYNHLLSFPDLPQHQLYLYSKADFVCYHREIAAFKDDQLEKGKTVKWKCWNDSEHVNHFGRHPMEYAELIAQHLESTLNIEIARKHQ
ncbi:unnamed protein product [Bursaphelenchus xylophilus]|uniref:(pine wood nematode) hypothetical protein n=1 Tax=Bursaphelenchus xylophilus TaxID=6326 RepID=A0A1I7RZ55_BURXY|nr:unnamed protein product [Bursaphelenchus xylophilus]CAG9106836.1 unnamed protein product [Bursaphelenchus xylophilus]